MFWDQYAMSKKVAAAQLLRLHRPLHFMLYLWHAAKRFLRCAESERDAPFSGHCHPE